MNCLIAQKLLLTVIIEGVIIVSSNIRSCNSHGGVGTLGVVVVVVGGVVGSSTNFAK